MSDDYASRCLEVIQEERKLQTYSHIEFDRSWFSTEWCHIVDVNS